MKKKTKKMNNKLNVLRAGVLGATDGIVSVAGVVIGVSSAQQSNTMILIAGVTAVLAGAFSMAGGEYVSVSTQADTEKGAIEVQKIRLESHFDEEKADVIRFYEAQGVSSGLAQSIADEMMEKNPLATTIEQKYDLEVGNYTNPWSAAITSCFSFVLGSLLPLSAMYFTPVNYEIIVTALAVTISLCLTGFISATLGKASRVRAIIRTVFVGLLTMVVTYCIGLLFR